MWTEQGTERQGPRMPEIRKAVLPRMDTDDTYRKQEVNRGSAAAPSFFFGCLSGRSDCDTGIASLAFFTILNNRGWRRCQTSFIDGCFFLSVWRSLALGRRRSNTYPELPGAEFMRICL